MRIWSLHPSYLDAKGLVALWRETLLAQKVLQGETRGYRNHPQLQRFREQRRPVAAVATYLQGVYEEALARGYSFDHSKISSGRVRGKMEVTTGQLEYELTHLKRKLKVRDAKVYDQIRSIKQPEPHPLFTVIDGDIAGWEVL